MPNHRKHEKSSAASINHSYVIWYGCYKTNTTEFSNASCTTYYVTTWAYWHVHTIYWWFYDAAILQNMMTSSDGNIFRIAGPLWGESTCGFPSQRPVTRSFDVFFDLCLNKRLSKHSTCRWFEAPWSSCTACFRSAIWKHMYAQSYLCIWVDWFDQAPTSVSSYIL